MFQNPNVDPRLPPGYIGRIDNCYDSRGSLDDITSQSHTQQRKMAATIEIDDTDRKIVTEFCYLQEKSKQLFNGLRDLPQFGHKQWQPYFGKAFDIFTRLWRFQQQHRQVLDSKYGLKRWQIGEIASKIGQLYYHYYLRTSETNYLSETFSFYTAIRARGYYSKAAKEETPDLMVKKLRYYARFIVVCLLLKKMKLIRDLVRELAKFVDDYKKIYEPEDYIEWTLVLNEIRQFMDAENLVSVIDVDGMPIIISHRLNPLNTPPLEKIPNLGSLQLFEILIVGNIEQQTKFSELTLDMFRLLQAFEREPQDDIHSSRLHNDQSPASNRLRQYQNSAASIPGTCPGPSTSSQGMMSNVADLSCSRSNPHKYLLFKPTIHQLLVFLSCGFKELPPNGVLLLYLSADGSFSNLHQPHGLKYAAPGNPYNQTMFYGASSPIPPGYEFGGVACNPLRTLDPQYLARNNLMGSGIDHPLVDVSCLHPADLYVYTRKPMCLIIDSDNSTAFKAIPRLFGQPLLVLMSPEESPQPFHEQQNGSLFTLFLHCPLTALCMISNIIEMPVQIWEKAQANIDRFLMEAGRLLTRCRNLDPVFLQFYADEFLRLLILRFIFCTVVLRMHRLFRNQNYNYAPCSHPQLPDMELMEQPILKRTIHEIAITLDIRSHFFEIDEGDGQELIFS